MTPKTEKPRAFVSVVSLQMREGPFTGKEQFDEPLDLVEIRAVTELEQRVESLKGLYEVAFTEAAVAEAKVTELEAENQRLSKDWECCHGNDGKIKEHTQDCPKYGNVEWITVLHQEEVKILAAKLKVAIGQRNAYHSMASSAFGLESKVSDLDAELAKLVPHG